MGLMVGELMAKIGADASGYMATSGKVKSEHKSLKTEVSQPLKIDGDSKPLEQANERAKKSSKDTGKAIDQAFASAAASVAADLQKIETEAWKSGRGMDQAFAAAVKSIQSDMERMQQEGAETGAGLQSDLGSALRRVKSQVDDLGGEFKQLGKEAKDAGDEAGSGLTDGIAGAFSRGKESFSTAGALMGTAVGAGVYKGVEAVFEQNEIGGLISAQNAGTAADARTLGDIAGDAFYDGFGDSVEDVGESLSAVIGQGLANATLTPRSEIEKLTKLAVTASSVVGEESNNIARAAKQLLVTGLAGNAEEAIDIIVNAAQHGVNASGDLIDTITEYGVVFQGLGLGGQEALGLISQAMQAGARDSDYAADALKEFNIRARETSNPDTVAGFRAIGLDAKKMGAEISAGGDRARAALDLTLDGLRAIHDPTARNAAAVQLFGTKAEDLGQSLYSMDLDTVAEQMGNLHGVTQDATDTMADARSPIDKLGRGLLGLANEGLRPVVEGWEYLFHVFDEENRSKNRLGGWVREADIALHGSKELSGGFKYLGDSAFFAGDQAGYFAGQTRDAASDTRDADVAVTGFVESLDELISKQQEYQTGVIDLHDAQIGFQQALAAGREQVEEGTKGFNLATEAGQKNQQTLDDIASTSLNVAAAMDQQNASQQDVTKHMEHSREEFIRTAIQLGATGKQARQMADQLRLIPSEVRSNARFESGTAMAKARELERYLNAVAHDRFLTIHVGAAGAGLNVGGGFFSHGFADGGFMPANPEPRAAGGGVMQAKPYLVGELGPELIWPDRAGYVSTAKQTADLARMAAAVNRSPIGAMGRSTMPKMPAFKVPADLTRALRVGSRSGAGSGYDAGGGSVDHSRHYSFTNVGPDPTAVARKIQDQIRADEWLHG